jgi:plasmid stabilization system protein ParE
VTKSFVRSADDHSDSEVTTFSDGRHAAISWYFDSGGAELAWRFFTAVDSTLLKLSRRPRLGRVRHFRNPLLANLRSLQIESPFQRLLVFYRLASDELIAERLMHGARDLPRGLVEPPAP